MFPLLFQTLVGMTHYIQLSCLYRDMRLFSTVTVSHFPWFWWFEQFWKVLVRYFVECPSRGIFLMFFSWLDWGYWFGEGRPQGKVPFSSHQIKCAYYLPDFSLLMSTMIIWLRYCSLGSPLKSSCLLPFSYCFLWKKVTLWCAHSRRGELYFSFCMWSPDLIY